MKKVILFEQFISKATNIKDIAKKILGELDDNAQLFPDYIPAEALGAIEVALKKNKSLIGKDAEKAAKQIRMNLEDIGILSNTFSPMDVELMIMNHLNESTTNEAWYGPFMFNDKMSDEELKVMYQDALDGYAYWQKGFEYPKSDYKKAYTEIEKILKKRGVKVDESLDEATTSWSKMMKGVKAGESGPWSLVAIENNKVVAQEIGIRIKDMLPARFEALRKEYPKAKIHIEDGTGQVVWNESINESKYNGNVAGDAAEYIAKELSHYVKGIVDQPNDSVTYFHLKDKSSKGKVIKTLLDVYGLEAQDGGTQFSPSATVKFDNDQIVESLVKEAKELDRDAMMDMMSDRYQIKTVRTTEEFDGQTGGIWMAGDNEETMGGKRIFDYYNKGAKYQNGVLKNVVAVAEKAGWWFSWNDPGTIMLWPKN